MEMVGSMRVVVIAVLQEQVDFSQMVLIMVVMVDMVIRF